MKNTKVNLKLFKALFIDKNPKLFQLIKKMDSFTRAMSMIRHDSFKREKNGRTILENRYIEEIDKNIKQIKNNDGKYDFTAERKAHVAYELTTYVHKFFEKQSREKLYNMHRIETILVEQDGEQGWSVKNAIGAPYLDLDNPGNNKLFWKGKKVDKNLISEFIKITEDTKTKNGRDVQIRLLDFNFGVSAEEGRSIPVRFLFHFINKNYRNKKIKGVFNLRPRPFIDYRTKIIEAVADTSEEYEVGDWADVIHNNSRFELEMIPRFKHYLDAQQEE